MGQLRSWSKGFGSRLVAVLLFLFAMAPALDSLVCEAEGMPAAAVSTIHAERQGLAHVAGGHDAETPGGCVHGHCHHNVPFPPLAAPKLTPQIAPAARFTPPAAALFASLPIPGPERPPRA